MEIDDIRQEGDEELGDDVDRVVVDVTTEGSGNVDVLLSWIVDSMRRWRLEQRRRRQRFGLILGVDCVRRRLDVAAAAEGFGCRCRFLVVVRRRLDAAAAASLSCRRRRQLEEATAAAISRVCGGGS
jgi:hypothetical protein